MDFLKTKSSLNLSNQLRVLDVWCWNWRLYSFLSWELDKLDYVWTDISENLLNEAKKSYPDMPFICQDMTDLSNFKDNSFDLIFSIAAFHHLYKRSDRLIHLKELKRILKPGWLIFITNWNLFQKKYISCFFNKFYKKRTWNDTHVPFKQGKDKLTDRYYHAFTPSELNKLYKLSDLDIKEEFFMRWSFQEKSFIGSFNICHILWE